MEKKKSKKGTKIQRLSLKKGEKRKHGAARAQSLEVILSIIHAHCPHHIASIRTAWTASVCLKLLVNSTTVTFFFFLFFFLNWNPLEIL